METNSRYRDRGLTGRSPRVLIGGVGYRLQRDCSAGMIASDRMAEENWPDGIEVMDLGYGALFAAQDLGATKPAYDRLIVLAAVERGRAPGRIYSYRWQRRPIDDEEVEARIREAGAGIIDVDNLLTIAQHLGTLPDDVTVIELEPSDTSGGDGLSERALRLMPEMIRRAQREALAPLKRLPTTPSGSRAAS